MDGIILYEFTVGGCSKGLVKMPVLFLCEQVYPCCIYDDFIIGGFTKGIIVDLSPHITSNYLLFNLVFKLLLLMPVFYPLIWRLILFF
jgi:hypothetical protein